MKDIHIVLGQRVKQCRNSMKLPREKLAEQIGVSPRFLADVEGGKVGVSIQTLKNICTALNISSDYLLELSSEIQNEQAIIIKKLATMDSKYHKAIINLIDDLQSI